MLTDLDYQYSLNLPHDNIHVLIKDFHIAPYEQIYHLMKSTLATKTPNSPFECWVGEHYLIATQGVRAHTSDVLDPSIASINTDRGGQTTLHLPGQLLIYPLFSLKTLQITPSRWVLLLQQVILNYLHEHHIDAYLKDGAPGIYTNLGKIASIGLRISNGWSYHGIALNLICPLKPYASIISCGQADLQQTNLWAHSVYQSQTDAKKSIVCKLIQTLNQECQSTLTV